MAIVFKLIKQQFNKPTKTGSSSKTNTTYLYFWGEADRRETKNGKWLVGSDIESGNSDFRLDNFSDDVEYSRCPKNSEGSTWQLEQLKKIENFQNSRNLQ